MVTLALIALLAQAGAAGAPGPADVRRTAVLSAIRQARAEIVPIPLQPGSAARGVMFDQAGLLAFIAREAGRAMTVEALMALDVPRMLVVAYPVACGSASARPIRVDLHGRDRRLRPAQGGVVANDALARMLPGFDLPPGAVGATFNRAPADISAVTIEFAEDACRRPAERFELRVTAPRKIRDTAPEWPSGVPRAGEVAVRVRATIERDGRPADVEMVSGPTEFTLSAAAALRQWRYEPMRINGVAVPRAMTMTMTFRGRVRGPQ